MTEKTKASILTPLIILILVASLFQVADWLARLVRLPGTLDLPAGVRIAGAVLIVGGAGLAVWLFRYRKPSAMMVSTYYTFRKLFIGAPVAEPAARTEPLVIEGPQQYVRHPLYLGAIIIFLGYALATLSPAALLGTIFVTLWLRFIQVPFEEKEMRALFGGQYVAYSRAVPMLLPFRLRRPAAGR